jgi:hypothetical protein
VEKQPTGRGPGGCDENGPAAAFLVGYVPHHFCTGGRKLIGQEQNGAGCALLAPCRRSILIETKGMLFRGQDTRLRCIDSFADRA